MTRQRLVLISVRITDLAACVKHQVPREGMIPLMLVAGPVVGEVSARQPDLRRYALESASYFNARNPGGLALAQNTLLPISVPRMGNLSYGLHPGMGPQTPATNIVNNGIHELGRWAKWQRSPMSEHWSLR